MEPRICSRCWRFRERGWEITIRAAGSEQIVSQHTICEHCCYGGFGHMWRTFTEIPHPAGKPPWEYQLSIVPWYPEE